MNCPNSLGSIKNTWKYYQETKSIGNKLLEIKTQSQKIIDMK